MPRTSTKQQDAEDEVDDPEVELLITTVKTKDYLGRLLVNPTPGTSAAKDTLGRDVKAGNLDYLGRALI